MAKNVALYGGRGLRREFCSNCRVWAFVIENKFKCCDSTFNKKIDNRVKTKRMTIANSKRKRPPRWLISEIVEKQENRCVYCDVLFGTAFIHPKKQRLFITTVCLDHFVPYNYIKANEFNNFVAACQICNGIKSKMLFENIEDAKAYIKHRRLKKGYDKEERN